MIVSESRQTIQSSPERYIPVVEYAKMASVSPASIYRRYSVRICRIAGARPNLYVDLWLSPAPAPRDNLRGYNIRPKLKPKKEKVYLRPGGAYNLDPDKDYHRERDRDSQGRFKPC